MLGQRKGFTLTELLVVIGVIILLIGILIPVISRVRGAGQVADTQQFISSLQGAIERYFQDHRAYPGPLSNDQIRAASGVTSTITGWNADEAARITMAENLVLGLLGGLENTAPVGSPAVIQYNRELLGQGPRSLNAANPRIYSSYIERANLSQGHFADGAGDAHDSRIPEFVDRFTDPLPILYLRARVGASSSGNTAADNPIVTDGTGARPGQYDLSQIVGYTGTFTGTFPSLERSPTSLTTTGAARSIGVGKTINDNEYTGGHVGRKGHGLQTVDPSRNLSSHYPYDLHPYLRHPSLANTPRQKDGYILISAGPDRVYGTADDIVSFGRVGQ